MEITQDQFEAYEHVRLSGATNMFNTTLVIHYAKEFTGIKLTREQVLHIMKNYTELSKKYDTRH